MENSVPTKMYCDPQGRANNVEVFLTDFDFIDLPCRACSFTVKKMEKIDWPDLHLLCKSFLGREVRQEITMR